MSTTSPLLNEWVAACPTARESGGAAGPNPVAAAGRIAGPKPVAAAVAAACASQAYDGRHPLVDVGCAARRVDATTPETSSRRRDAAIRAAAGAYGKNTCAAADIVKAAIGTPAPDEVRVVACDFEEGHLAYALPRRLEMRSGGGSRTAPAVTRIFRKGGSRRRRGCHADIP